MKVVGRTFLTLVLIGLAVGSVIAIPGIINRARWYEFTQRATRFMGAVDRQDLPVLRNQAADTTLIQQVLSLRARRPALVRSAAESLTLERAQREGDTVLVALRTTHSSCAPPGDADRLRIAFVMKEGEYRVAWLSAMVCRASP